jgi:threonine/homoserine/homoserine lactone efflux protein
MDELIRAFVAGMFSGFVVSVPVGPVNLSVINHGVRKGFWPAFLVGMGAICAESVYAALMLAGHSWVLENRVVAFSMHLAALAVMTVLGIRYLLFNPEKLDVSERAATRADARWHHPRSFVLGFLLTASNALLLLLWAAVVAVLFGHEWVLPAATSRAACLAGVFAGGATWFCLLAFAVSRAHRRIGPATLTRLVRGCGAVLLLFAGLLAYKLFAAAPPAP